MDERAWSGVVLILVALAVASRGFRVDDEYVARWARAAGLALTDETRPTVRRLLTWSRRSRTAGGLLGFLAPLVYAQVANVALGFQVSESDAGGWSVLLMFAGYLLGALFAEIVINRPRQHEPGLRASRPLEDYLSRYLVVTQRGLGISCAALVGAYAVLAPVAEGAARPDPGFIAIFGLTGVTVAAVIELLERTIIGRRQPATSPTDIAVDDAIRSTSVHLVAGTGIALLIVFAAGLIAALVALVGSTAGMVGLALMLLLFPISIAFWLDSGSPQGFRVPRTKGENG